MVLSNMPFGGSVGNGLAAGLGNEGSAPSGIRSISIWGPGRILRERVAQIQIGMAAQSADGKKGRGRAAGYLAASPLGPLWGSKWKSGGCRLSSYSEAASYVDPGSFIPGPMRMSKRSGNRSPGVIPETFMQLGSAPEGPKKGGIVGPSCARPLRL